MHWQQQAMIESSDWIYIDTSTQQASSLLLSILKTKNLFDRYTPNTKENLYIVRRRKKTMSPSAGDYSSESRDVLPSLSTFTPFTLYSSASSFPFSSLFSSSSSSDSTSADSPETSSSKSTRQDVFKVVIFIRHFFCGACQDYIESFSKNERVLQGLKEKNARVVVVGHGEKDRIEEYKSGCCFALLCHECLEVD